MNRIFNPFRYIAGTKSLIFGLLFIATSALLLYSGGYIQNTYIHIGMATVSLWRVVAMQILWWLLPAVLLYLCGRLLSKSKIRIIDILGTTAFAQLVLLMMIAPMLLPAVSQCSAEVMAFVQSGADATSLSMLPLVVYSFWSMICLVLFFIWNYNAFAVSCNVGGWKAIVAFIAVQVAVTIVGTAI